MVVLVVAAAAEAAVLEAQEQQPRAVACSWSWRRNPCPWVALSAEVHHPPGVAQVNLGEESAGGAAAETLAPVPVLPSRPKTTFPVEDSY